MSQLLLKLTGQINGLLKKMMEVIGLVFLTEGYHKSDIRETIWYWHDCWCEIKGDKTAMCVWFTEF